MARRLPRKDAVIIGLGWTGSILAHELTDAGLDVVAIERGPWRDTATDFPISYAQDEWRYRLQHELFLRPAQTTVTFRNNADQTALPVRNWGAFMLGNGVGGGGLHWNAETFRFLPSDFVTRSHLTERYGESFLPEDMTIQDWGVTYDDLEPHYDQFEYLCGTSGTAGNIKGEITGRRQPVRGRSLAALSDAGAEAGLWAYVVRRGRQAARLQAVSAAVGKSVAGLYQSARRQARPMHLLRFLRMVRLRQLFQGEPADDHSAGAAAQIEFRGAHRVRSDAHQSRSLRQMGDRRDLRGYIGRRVGAAGRSRAVVRVPALQRPASAALGHRHALRSADRQGPDRPQLHPSDRIDRGRLLRQGQIQLQSVRRLGLDRHVHRRVQRRQFRSRPARLCRRRLYRPGAHQRPPARKHGGAAGHAGLGRKMETGAARQLSELGHLRSAPVTAPSTAIATSISISIRPTKTASAAR